MKQKIIIESLAMDLKRLAIGKHRGSLAMADRFKKEAFARADELKDEKNSEYLQKLIAMMRLRINGNSEKEAEDALMLSVLFQNFALKKSVS